MKQFAVKLIIFAGLFLIYDKIFLIVANRSAETEIDKRLEYLINGKINKDIIITGSSTGSRDIIAKQIEDGTGLSAYNLCYPGSDVEFHEFILRTLVKFNDPPKIVLLVVDDFAELIPDSSINFRKDRLYPLVKYKYIRKELIKRKDKDRFFSSILVLHSLNKYNFDLRQKRFTALDSIKDCGSMPISWKTGDDNWDFIPGQRIYPANLELAEKVNAYKEIVRICHSYQINLTIIFPPIYEDHTIAFENRIRDLSGDRASYFFYRTDNPVYRNKDYYYDGTHLLLKGAVIFTDELIVFLRSQYINEMHIDKNRPDLQYY